MTPIGRFICVAALVAAGGCRHQGEPAPLQPDPVTADRLAQEKADIDMLAAAARMTPRDAASLEAGLASHPEDLAARRKLVAFYTENGRKIGRSEATAGRRRHILWMIAHHPGDPLTGAWVRRLSDDPVGYAGAKALWTAELAAERPSSAVLANAAAFFQTVEPRLAERVLLRGAAADPDGPPRAPQARFLPQPWSARLGVLYASVLISSNPGRSVLPQAKASPGDLPAFQDEARKKLADSADPVLLTAAGSYMINNFTRNEAGAGSVALGRSLVERAATLAPASPEPQQVLVALKVRERNREIRTELQEKQFDLAGRELASHARAGDTSAQQKIRDLEYQALSTFPEGERFAWLPWLAESAYLRGEAFDDERHQEGARGEWQRSKKYAEDLLALAATRRGDPAYGTAIYKANITLATLALREGSRERAVRYMREAAKAPASDELAYYIDSPLRPRLVNYLLKYGERDSVVDFLDALARINVSDRERLRADAAAIRAGRMPESYQAMVARGEV